MANLQSWVQNDYIGPEDFAALLAFPEHFQEEEKILTALVFAAQKRGELSLDLNEDNLEKLFPEEDNDLVHNIITKAEKYKVVTTKLEKPNFLFFSKKENHLFLYKNYITWKKIQQELSRLQQRKIQSKTFKTLDKLPLNQDQKSAIKASLQNSIMVLTGGPGTGKTFTILGMIAVHLANGILPNKIKVAAPTGKAANRLVESLKENGKKFLPNLQEQIEKIESSTIHHLLDWHPTGFYRNKLLPLMDDLVIIDEASMMEASIMLSLLEAIGEKTKLILVGDPNQLPPVGVGPVFEHLVKEGSIPKVTLKENYRSTKKILEASQAVLEGNRKHFWQQVKQIQIEELKDTTDEIVQIEIHNNSDLEKFLQYYHESFIASLTQQKRENLKENPSTKTIEKY
ncbi:MAG: hypothetical protein D6767_01110, partial [Candidatus Hydrogenedentota bacterium]